MTQPVPARVAVLLSTYNGSKWLRPQLDSILDQVDVETLLCIRDDGSSDDTVAIVQEYADRDARIRFERGSNLGVVRSYFELLTSRPPGVDFVAFSDQDDVWLPRKLRAALDALAAEEAAIPRLYCCRTNYVDENLKSLGLSRLPRRVGFSNALVENMATGCTVVMNRAAADLIATHTPEAALMHDWWCYLVVSAFGEITFDSTPWILYRQHGGNVVGGRSGWFETLPARVRRLRLRKDGVFRCSGQAKEFERCHGDQLPPDKGRLLRRFLAARESGWSAIRLAMSGQVRRSAFADDLILRALIPARIF